MDRFNAEQIRRDFGVPRVLTSGHHLFVQTALDEWIAELEWGMIHWALTEPAKSAIEQAEFGDDVSSFEAVCGEAAAAELREAFAKDAISEAEITRRVINKELRSKADRDHSYHTGSLK